VDLSLTAAKGSVYGYTILFDADYLVDQCPDATEQRHRVLDATALFRSSIA